MESPWGERDWQYYTDYSELPLCILQLDPADRAVIRIADERDAVQKKTFTKWINKHLLKAGRKIVDLYEDLRDGHNLISLLEVLAHDILPRERGHMRFHKIQNVQIALDFLRMKGIKLVNIRSDEIVDGNPKLTLGLIWTIILHFQISDVVVPGQEDITAKDALLLWSRRTTDGYPGVKIRDFSSSWRDGKAFLSILHRNRPELVDMRQLRQNSNKQNLESAFSIAEREFGVTRLLDVDDVDVPNPDEKSIITYVSSLYDVFPEVPSVEQSLKDNERKLKVEEYRDLASSLLTWIRDSIKLMLSRNYPTTLMEMKALQSDFSRFCHEDVPPRLEIRNRILRLFDEIQSLTADPSQMNIEDEFLPHNVSRMWSRFEAAMQERDMTLQAEVIRLERLHRLAEKAKRDVRYNEETLADLGSRIDDLVQDIHQMHASEAKRNCDALDRGLKSVEESLRGLFRDCQTLQDGGHPLAEQLYRRVSDLQAQVSSLRNRLYSEVVHPLLVRSGNDGQGSLTKSRAEVVSEGRLMETEPSFRHLQDCLDWIGAKQKQLEESKLDSDLSRVLEQLDQHRKEHEEIQSFRSRIDKCISDRANLSSEEQKVYTQKLSKVEVAYSLLSKTSSSRLRCLKSLSEFLQLASAELMWLSEREETELSRDWGSKDLNLPELEEYHKSLERQMEARESQFNSVQEKGGAMILDRHPSARTVEAYMSTLQSQWSWLVHLSWCLEAQIKHCTEHNSFFQEAHHCEQWMARHSELLQHRFSSDNIPIDQAQVLLKDLQDLQDQVREYDRRVSALVVKSRDIIPLKLRSQRVTAPIRVRTLCACHQQDISLQRGEECFLVNNSQRTKWKIKTMTGLEADVPSVCLLIPPPNQEAIDLASRLKLQHERLSSQWKTQQRKVRLAAISAAIKQIKDWDLKKFLSLDPAQRETVWHALKEDGQKLLAECGTTDRDMRKLSDELAECERIYLDLCEKAAAKEGKRSISTAQVILQKVETVGRELTATDQQLSTLLHRPLPQNNLAVQESFRSYREFQLRFDKQETEIRTLQTEVKELSPRNSNIESKLSFIIQKADQIKVISHIYVDRLKGCEVVISGMNEIKQLITDFESSLSAHDNMTSDLSELKSLKNELVGFQESLQLHQPKLQHLKEDVESLRTLVERSRPGTTKHHDVDSVEKEVNGLVKRWDQICIQVVERLRSVGSCQDLLSLYHNGLHTEQTWASQMEKRISSQPSLNGDVTDAKQQLEPTMAIYNALGDRRYQIESVNRHGGQFIREAKISDKRLKQFKDSVSELSGLSQVSDSKKLKRLDGAEVVRDELDRLNKLYMEMVDWANMRLRQISSTVSAHGDMQFQIVIDEDVPLLRTFRAELAKRSSMLVDADMREYFTQQFDGPTPSQAIYGTTPEQLYKTSLHIRPESTLTAELAEVTKVIRIQPKSKQIEDAIATTIDTASLAEFSKTLQAMENSSTLVSSKVAGTEHQSKYLEQILVTVSKEEITLRGQLLHVTAILNPNTSQKVTLVEALQTGLIDAKSKTFVDPSTHQRLPLTQAARKGYVDEVVLKQLTSPCGSFDPQTGQELSLIEAIQKKMYDPASNKFTDATTGEQVSVSEAVARGIISESCSRILAGETVQLTFITRTQAVFTHSESFRLDVGLSLGQVVEKGLCSEITGKVFEPISGTDMSIMEAVEKEFINPGYQEIKNPKGVGYITLTEAVAAGIVDPFKGTFNHKSTNEKLSLSVAHSKGLVRTASSLADIVSQGNLTENGHVFDATSGQVITLSEAIKTGVISSDKKCILDPSTNEVLSLKETVTKGIMTPSGLFVNPEKKSRHPVLEALKLGLVKLIQDDVQFSRSGVKDSRTSEVVTLSEAIKRGIFTPQGLYIDSRTGREMNLQQAANAGLVDRGLVKDLNKPTSMKDGQGKNISIVEALRLGILDTQNGSFENVRTGESLTMQEATSLSLIKASDARNVLSLLSPMMSSSTVLTQAESPPTADVLTVAQAVSQGYLNERTGFFTDPRTGHSMPLEEAIQKGLLKLSSEWPSAPSLLESVGETDSQLRRVQPEAFMTDTSRDKARTIPIESGSKKFESSYMTKSGSDYSFTTTTLAKPLLMQSVISETREINLMSVLDPRTGRELDVEDAIKRGLISLESGQYTHPITGERMPLNKAIERGFIKAEQVEGSQKGGAAIKDTRVFSIVGVLHPHTRKRLAVSQAIAYGILDQANGVYNNMDHLGNPQPMKISEAIEKGFIIVEDIGGELTIGPDSMLRETKSYILKSILHPVTGKHMSIADAIAEGIIDESEGLYINPVTGEKMHIHSAIEQGLILAELTSVKTDVDRNVNKITTTKLTTLSVTAVVDPRTGNLISVSKAIEEGILNQTKGIYTNPQTGESMSLGDAIDRRLVLAESPEAQSDDPLERAEISSIHITDDHESHEATLTEDIHSETVTMSITSVVDPKTMEMISYDEAVESGILNVGKGTYINLANGETMTITAALEQGLIHGEVTSQRREDDIMRSAVSAATPLKDITSVIDPRTGREISFDKAVKDGIINPDKGTYYNPKTNTEIDLSTAKKFGYLLESKQSSAAQMEKSLEEENLLQAQLSTPHLPRETKKPWSKIDIELEKTVTYDESMENSSLAKEVLQYSTEIENDSSQNTSLRNTVVKGDVQSGFVMVLDTSTGEKVPMDVALAKGLVDKSGSVLDKQSGKKSSPQEALKTGLMIIAGAPFMAGKMVVDALTDRSSSAAKKTTPDSDTSGFQISRSRTVMTNIIQPDISTSRSGHSTGGIDEAGITPVHIGGQKGAVSPTVGVVNKPVTITVDPGSPAASSIQKTGKATTITFQQKMSIEPSQVSSSNKSGTSLTAFSESKTDIPHTEYKDLISDKKSTLPQKPQVMSPGAKHINVRTSDRTGIEDFPSGFSPQSQDIQTKTHRQASVKDLDINLESGTVINKLSGQRLTLKDAVQKGLIDSDLVEDLVNSSTQQFYTSPEINIDWAQGRITDQNTKKTYTIESALQKGLIDIPTASALASATETATQFSRSAKHQITNSTEPYTLNMAVREGKYNAETGQLIDPTSGLRMSVKKALNKKIIDGVESTVIDPQTGQEISLQKAIDSKVFDSQKGELIHKASRERISLQEADLQGLIPESVQKQSNIGGDVETLTKPTSGKIMSMAAAFESHFNASSNNNQTSHSEGKSKSPVKPAVKDSVSRSEKDTKFVINRSTEGPTTDQAKMSFAEALDMGLINLEDQQFLDPSSGRRIALSDAIQDHLIDTTTAVESHDGEGESLTQVIDNGLFDEQRGVFHDARTNEEMSFKEAVDSGRIDGKFSVYDVKSGEIYSLDEGLKEGKIDPATGRFIDEESGRKMTLKEAAKLGVLAVVGAPIAAAVAAKESLSAFLNDSKNRDSRSDEADSAGFAFQTSGTKHLSSDMQKTRHLQQNIPKTESFNTTISNGQQDLVPAKSYRGAENMYQKSEESTTIHSPSFQNQSVIDPSTKRNMPVSQAVEKGVLDVSGGSLINTRTGDSMLKGDALKQGLLKGTETILNSAKADQEVTEGHRKEDFDSKNKKMKGLINEESEMFCDSVGPMSLRDTMKHGLVDGKNISKTGVSVQKQYDSKLINEHLLALDEALGIGHSDESCTVFTDPVTGLQMKMNDAMKEGLVAEEYLTFHDAMKRGLIDPDAGTFLDESSQKMVSVDEAVRSGLLVASDGRPYDYKGISDTGVTYSFKAALQTGIIDSDTCLFYDSLTGEHISIEAALEESYLSPIAGTYGGRAIGESVVMLKEGVAPSAASSLEEIIDSKTGEKLSLAEAEKRGLVSVVKANSKMTLQEAIQSGLVDSDSGLFHDPMSGDSMPLDQAVLSGVIAIDDKESGIYENDLYHTSSTDSMNIAAAISQGYLDTATATFTDPYSQETLSVSQAIQRGLLKPALSVEEPDGHHTAVVETRSNKPQDKLQRSQKVKSNLSQETLLSDHDLASGITQSQSTTTKAQRSSVLDNSQSSYLDSESTQATSAGSRQTPLQHSISQDKSSRPVTPGRMGDSYDKLVQDISGELQRLQGFEQVLKEDAQMGDEASKIQSQLEVHKALHTEILDHQHPILSLVYQAEQLTELYQEELTPEQVTSLCGEAANLKKALEKVVKTSERRLKHLKIAAEELSKLEAEMSKFISWKASSRSELVRLEECLQRFEDLKHIQESQKELLTDVMSHQADVRFMSIAVQKYVEEAKLHKLEVDSFRADRQRPARSSLISMDCIAADVVRDKLKDISDDYSDLKHRCSAFGDLLSELSTKQRGFNDAAFKMLSWLADTEDELASIKQESGTPEPDQLYGQLDRIKALSTEVLSQSGLMDDVHKKGRDFTNSLSGVAADRDQVEKIEENIEEIDARYASINEAVSAQAKLLQATITQSQDIQGAISDIQSRLRSAEVALTSLQPISLQLPLISEQEQQFRLIAADVNSYGDSVESIRQATRDLIKSGDLHVARTIEQQLADIEDQFKKVHDTCDERAGALREIGGKLADFHDKLDTTQSWLQSKVADINSSDFNNLPVDEAGEQLAIIAGDKKKNEKDIVQLKEIAKKLQEDPRTGSPASINKAISDLEKIAAEFEAAVTDKQTDISLREKQANEFETAKTLMLLWLAQMEARVDEFEPAAMEVDFVEKQIAELQPMLEEFEEQGVKVDEVNDLGNALEALTSSSDRPFSPIRRLGRPRRIIGLASPHLRSPSPTFPLSPTALKSSMSSESSGVSSRKSSSDNILLDDLSQTQQQLLDINQRYEILGERLADRQQELQNILASIRTFLQDMQEVLTWLDGKDNELSAKGAGGIPANEKAAKKKLKEHEEFHRELLNREGLVEDIRKKAQELLKSKPGVPGLDTLQTQLNDLDEKWHGLRAMSEEHRKGLEDAVSNLRDFREHEDQLSRWFAQKEKLMDVLGPVAMEPSLLKSQLEQVKVLKEEFAAQHPTYDQFVNTGHVILDWCDANTSDSSAISKRMDAISKSWNKLQGRLKEREKSIESVQGLSGDFSSITRGLANWLGDFNDRIDALPKVSSQSDKQQAQKLEMQNLQQEMQDKLPEITKAKDLCLQLCDATKDLSTKTDLRAKMTALDRDINDTLKKLESRADAIEEASKAEEEFTANCKHMLDWIQTTASVLKEADPLSSDADLLQKQAVQTKAMRQDLNLKEGEVRSLLDKGNKFIHDASPSAETRGFKETLTQMEDEWAMLKDAVKDRENKIGAVSTHAQDFQQNLDKMTWWLGTAEERLKKITPESLDKASIAANLKELQSLQNEFLKKSHDHDSFNKTATSLLNAVEDPNHELQGQVDEVNTRWDAFDSGLSEKAKSLEDLQNRLAEIEDNKADAKHSLTRWEDKLAAHMDMGTAARDPKHVDKIKTMQEDISAIQPQLEYLDRLIEGLGLSEDVDSTDLENELRGLRVRYDQLQNEVGELLSNIEAGSSIVGQFQDMMKKVAGELSDLDNDLSNLKPVSRDENELDAQLLEIQNFQRKLSDKSEPLIDLKEQARDLQLAGFVSDPDGLNVQVESLLNQHNRLKDRTNQRLSEIETNRDKVHRISDALKGLHRKIDDAVTSVDSMKPVGSSANQINEQQEELKKFSKSHIEPLQKELNSLNFDMEALIKSAPSGVNTGGIDEDLQALQEAWSELSEKVSERERNLDKALLQSGKFKEALASLLAWLGETEDTVASQKQASPEFRVVKAQLQEQKLLQKMIDDKAPSVTTIEDTGNQLLSRLDGADRSKMDTELKSLDKRWTALTSNVTERMKTLEEMSDLAKHFQDIHEPLAVWLDVSDKKFASLEPKSPNAGGFEKLINDLKKLQVEIAEHENSAKELAALGKRLQDFCKGEDVVLVQMKIDNIQKQFSDLKNKVDDSLEQMEEALPLAKNFQDAHEKFVEWVAKVEPELRGKESAGVDADEKVKELVEQLEAVQPYIDIINDEGAELAEVAPGDAGLHVEEIISKDNKRYDSLRQQIEKRAEKVKMSRQRSFECINELDDLLEWFNNGEDKLSSMSPISAEPGKLQKQLAEIKSFTEEVSDQKVKVRDAITSGKKLLRDSSKDDMSAVQEKIDQLKHKSQFVGSLAAERLSGLEHALPLAKSFQETHDDLVTWLDEVEPALADLEVTTVDVDQVRKQHESIKALKKDVADHKPVIDRLNKTGSALVQLVSPEAAVDVQNKLDDDNRRVEDVRTGVRERSNSIDAAMQQSAEFTDKLEDMLETLTTTAETVHNAEPVSAHPDRIREQIEQNKMVYEEMQMKSVALESVKEAADELIKQAGDATDPAVRDVRQKLAELTRLYSDIENNCQDRGKALDDALGVSEKFWEDLNTLSGSIKELQDGLGSQEKPALEPEAIREQQEELEAFKEDLATTQADLEDLQEIGDQLMSVVGDPERPEVQKNLNDTEETLHNITDQVEQRSKDLDVALGKALTFQEELQKMLVWLQTQEDTFNMMEPVASDLETITSQWNDIKVFKGVVDPKHMEVEALNQQAEELTKDCTAEQAAVVREPVNEVNQRWDALHANIADRQRDIQMALLNLGEFDQAFKDFKAWLETVDENLDELEPLYGDPKIVELELAKLRIIANDIAAHQGNLDLLTDEAGRIMSQEKTPEANKLKKKMEDLVQGWDKVKEKAAKKQLLLEDARREARGFTEEMQNMLMKISDLDGQLITSQPVGGLPETAKEQLEKFMDIYEELEKLEPAVQSLQLMSEKLAAKSHGDPAASIKDNMTNLHQKLGHAMNRAADRKKKLEDAVGLAANFHDALNKFIGWLTDTEKTLNNLQPVSRLIDKVTKQIEDHRVLQKDVSGHREAMFALDKMGTHLKYFSQKQDIVLIKNLLSSAQHRWEKIVSRSAERTRHLERGYKEAKQFLDSWKDLIQWLTEAEQALNSETNISNEPEKIKAQIARHKEFQRRLGAKQPVYDSINRAGSALQNRCPADDKPAIQSLLADLKNRWNAVCGKSVDRQRKLEEGLLFTGQFNEALEALLDWLVKVEPTLAEDTQVHGDLDTVNGFLETHKAFQQELGARATTVQFVRKSAKDLIEKSNEDMSHVQSQLIELSTLWDRTCKLSVSKQQRLEQAYRLADEFHNKAQDLLDWLADAERQLRFKGAIPDEESAIIQQIEDHKKFEESMLRQEAELRETLNIGQDIMKRCHPDAVSTMKHWLGVLRARWEELMGLSKQRQKRLTEALANARLNSSLLEELLVWLNAAEVKLTDLDKEPIPKDLQIVQDLIAEHQGFQNEMSSKQPSVDRLTKADKRKAGSDTGSHIPVFRGAKNTRSKIPTIRVDRVNSAGRKTPDFFGRRTPEHFSSHRTPSGRKTPDVSGRKTPDVSGRMTPDYSGRKTPDHMSGRRTPDYHSGRRTPEPGFSNPRVGALFNKWRHVWLLTMYRQRKLQDALDYLNELERLKNFEFEDWRKRYLRWMNHNKARIMDFFRRQDHDRDGRVTRQEFIDGILQSKFPTSRLEMEAVADIFDKDGDGFINYKEFVAALRPDRDPKPETDSEKILDEVRRQVSKCTCVKQFKIHKIGEGKYRFGDSQKLRLVRILRSTVMVRVGGGWIALDEFLVKNDPCRAKGRTNIELRERFILAEGVSQSMAGFVSKSPAGSSHSSGSSYSGRSTSTASGPITKIREKTVHQTPWRQTKVTPDGEVHEIMSHTEPDGTQVTKHKVTQELRSPRNIASPASRSSSRASTGSGSRPTSRTGSEAPDDTPEVFTTTQTEKKNVGGRNDTTVTYQTHVVQTRNVTLPTVTTTKISRIPKSSTTKKK